MKPRSLTRRQFGHHLGGALGGLLLTTRKARAEGPNTGLRVLKKEIHIPARDGTGVFPGFVTYVHREKNVLLQRFGWVNASDTYDDFHDRTSEDNGETWSEPVLKLKGEQVEGGIIRYCENAAFFDEDTDTLITVVSKFFYPDGKFNQDQPRQLEIAVGNPLDGGMGEPRTLDFGLPGGMACSFSFPIKTRAGRIVVPGFKSSVGEDGEFLHHPKSGTVISVARMVIGEYRSDGSLEWRVGQPIVADNARSTRGFSECTPVELADGRLAALLRGSNEGAFDLPGYKWLTFSSDGGESWEAPKPFHCSDGEPIESSATGGALFRSIKDENLYFIGNLCADGGKAKGNWPRSPLYIARVREDPFVLDRASLTIIDEKGNSDSPTTQISNFRYYQDRETGDVVLFATRFGEKDSKRWKDADHYRYRVAIG